MKIYYICEEAGPEWWVCSGVLSNGFCFGQHICSNQFFAPHDLLLQRKKRLNALKQLFDLEPTSENQETIVVRTLEDIPSWWKDLEEKQESLRPIYKEYEELIAED